MDSRNAVKAEKLGDFVKRIRLDKDLSLEAVSLAAKRSGFKISGSYINKIENGDVKPTGPYLQALAKGLGITEEEIFAIARGVVIDDTIVSQERFSQIAEGYKHLSEQEKENVELLIKTLEATIEKSETYRQYREQKGAEEMKKSSGLIKKTPEEVKAIKAKKK